MDLLRLESCTVDLRRRLVRTAGGTVRLSPKEADLLAYLAARPGRTAPRDELLREVWGYREGVVTRTLDTTVRTLRTKIEADRSAPTHIITDPGGYRFEPRLVPPAAPAPRPPADPPPFRLPESAPHAAASGAGPDPDSDPSPRPEAGPVSRAAASPPDAARAAPPRSPPLFHPPPGGPTNTRAAAGPLGLVGRRGELADVEGRLTAGAGLVSVVGVPGVGKSRLARAVAARTTARHPDRAGALLCDLSDCDTLEEALRALTDTLAPGDDEPASAAHLARRLFELGPALLVLDNADLSAAELAPFVAKWRDAAPELQLLVTCRERLHLQHESCVRLDPLPQREAVELLVLRARDAGISLDADATASLHELAARLDGIPLALELASARIGDLGPRGVLDRLSQGFSFLHRETVDGPPRHATLHDAIQVSWDLLPPWARDAWTQTAVFVGGFDLPAARAVIDLSRHHGAPSVDQALALLAERGLLRRHAAEELRYTSYEALRAFARRRLDLADHGDAARLRHVAWFMRMASQAAGLQPDDARLPWWCLDLSPVPELEAERPNLLHALTTALRLKADTDAVALAVALFTGALAMPLPARLDHAEGLRAALPRLAPAHVARARLLLAALGTATGRITTARADLEAALPEAVIAADVETATDLLTLEASLCSLIGAAPEGTQALDRAAALAASPLRDAVRHALRQRAAATVILQAPEPGDGGDRLSRAEDNLTVALGALRRPRTVGAHADTLRLFSVLYRVTGRTAQATACAAEALGLAAASGLKAVHAQVALEIGRIALQEGHAAEARARFAFAVQQLRALGARVLAAEAAHDLARAHLVDGHADVALEVLDAEWIPTDEPDLHRLVGREQLVRGAAEALLGRHAAAVASLTHAEAQLERAGDRNLAALAAAWCAAQHLCLRRPDAAEEALTRALAAVSATPGTLRAVALVHAALATSQTPAARRSLATARADLQATTRPGSPTAAEPLVALIHQAIPP